MSRDGRPPTESAIFLREKRDVQRCFSMYARKLGHREDRELKRPEPPSLGQMAARLSISEAQIESLIADGRLPPWTWSRRWLRAVERAWEAIDPVRRARLQRRAERSPDGGGGDEADEGEDEGGAE